jgi:hypothetical protein
MNNIPAHITDAANEADERVTAACDLVGRTGARELKVGYLHDDVPAEQADWYAHATYQGARVTVEHHRGPVEALEALAQRLLTGAQCQHCRGLVALSRAGAMFYPGARRPDGSAFEFEEAVARPQCRWRRVGPKWIPGCTS